MVRCTRSSPRELVAPVIDRYRITNSLADGEVQCINLIAQAAHLRNAVYIRTALGIILLRLIPIVIVGVAYIHGDGFRLAVQYREVAVQYRVGTSQAVQRINLFVITGRGDVQTVPIIRVANCRIFQRLFVRQVHVQGQISR